MLSPMVPSFQRKLILSKSSLGASTTDTLAQDVSRTQNENFSRCPPKSGSTGIDDDTVTRTPSGTSKSSASGASWLSPDESVYVTCALLLLRYAAQPPLISTNEPLWLLVKVVT